ncbi:Non-canonical poly(A) RNA polymerase PAPD5 [Favolaschia claudopus]|uniref:polynucleotide adenylyltransferase n=1 Tax=Favolaschia claudopus TaxID=2862362 RepID=A0AAW0EGL2_9AGAR
MSGQKTRETRGRVKSVGVEASPQNAKRPIREKRKRSPAPVAPEDEHVLTPWLDLIPKSVSAVTAEQRLHQEIVAYVEYVQSTPQEKTARQTLLEVIQRSLQPRFPGGEVKMFGSQATGLSLPAGDMDLVVMTREEISPTDKKRPLFQMSTILKAARLTWDVQVNFHARVPILKFQSLPEFGSFSVDIGINNTDGPQAIAIVNDYLAKMPALRPLILAVKGFLSQRDLNNAAHSGLGSYAVICMCISFLQLNPSKRPQEYIDKPMETDSLGALLADFMFYYGIDFPYADSYISVSEGKLLPKESAPWAKTNKVPDGLAIQCLVNPEIDVGKSAGRLNAIRTAFKEGYATILQMSLGDGSLLGPLVSFTQSMIDHRTHIQHIVDSGKLEAAVSPPPRHPRHRPAPKQAPAARAPLPTPSSLRPDTPPEHVPYGSAFGASSAMGRNGHNNNSNSQANTNGNGSSVNRKGSGFPSRMRSEGCNRPVHVTPASRHPHFDPEWPPLGGGGSKTTRRSGGRPQNKRRRRDEGGGGS